MGELNTKMTALADEIRELGGVSNTLGIAAMTNTISAANVEILRQVELLEQIAVALESKINGSEERLEGDGQEFCTMAPSTLSFRSTEPLAEFQEVQVNGRTVDPTNYELEEGSTIVKLKYDYLSTLNKGKYEVAVVSDSKTVKGEFTVAAPELNGNGFYYNQPYYAENIEVGDGINTASGTVAFILLEDGTAQYINLETGSLSNTSFSYENDVYTINLLSGQFTGTFSSDGRSFVTSKVFLPGGGWLPDYNGTEQIEFKLDSDNIAADEEYFYLVNNGEALPINKFKKSYAMPRTNIGNKAIINFTNGAFSNNTELDSVNFIPNGFETISSNMFSDCLNLTSVIIPDSVTSIGHRAFYNCTSLTSIAIGNGVTYINNSAFQGCSSLISVIIPDSITSIDSYAFEDCKSLTSVIIPNSVINISDHAFQDCSGLTSIIIGDSVNSIGDSAFAGCTCLTSVVIPDSVTSIGNGAFSRCLRLPSIVVTENNPVYKSMDGILYNKDGKTLMQYPAGKTGASFTIPNSVTSINTLAFNDCDGLTNVVIGDNVTSIRDSVFQWCSLLTNIVISCSVMNIGSNVFNSCYRLTSITFEGTMDQWNSITKHSNWNLASNITYVQCSDGQVTL